MRKLTLLLLFLLTSAIALSQDYYFDSVLSYDDENETVLYNYYSRVSLTPHKDHDIEVKLDGNKVIKYNMIYKETEGVHNGVKFVEYRMLALEAQKTLF